MISFDEGCRYALEPQCIDAIECGDTAVLMSHDAAGRRTNTACGRVRMQGHGLKYSQAVQYQRIIFPVAVDAAVTSGTGVMK